VAAEGTRVFGDKVLDASRGVPRHFRNRGRNGLELLSVLVTDNIIGEASRIGYGSAIAVVLLTISIVPIVIFVWNSFQEADA